MKQPSLNSYDKFHHVGRSRNCCNYSASKCLIDRKILPLSVAGHNVGTDGFQNSRRKTARGSSFNNKPANEHEKLTVHTVPVATARSSTSNLTSPKSEMESTNPVLSSVPFSGEIHVEDFSFNKGQLGTSRLTTTSGHATPALGLSVSSLPTSLSLNDYSVYVLCRH